MNIKNKIKNAGYSLKEWWKLWNYEWSRNQQVEFQEKYKISDEDIDDLAFELMESGKFSFDFRKAAKNAIEKGFIIPDRRGE